MKNPVRVLCVQSFPDHAQEIISLLRDGGYEPSHRHVSTLEDFQSVISAEPWDIILCDYHLTDCDVLQVLLEREAAHVEAPLIVLAQDISCEYVAAAMRAGAADCVARGNLSGLFTVIQRELRRSLAKKTKSEADRGVKAPALTDLDLERRQRELHRLNVMLRDEIAIRRQAEDALRESEQRFRVMADNTPVIIWVHDPEGKVQFVNRSYCEFFGVSERELKAKGWQMVVHPDEVASVADEFMESLRNQTSFHATARVRRYDGQWRWVESYGEPRFSSAHVFLGIAGSSVDITERREAERVLATHVKDLMFLSRSATGLLEPMPVKALFDYLARHLHSVAGEAIIVVSEYDALNNQTIVRAIAGPEEKTRKVERLLGRDLVGLALPVAEGTVQRMIAGNLAHVGGGLFDLSFGQIPKPVCVELEQELSLGRIYAMPFALDPDFLGTVAVLTDRAEGLKNRSVIEACVNQAGLALKRQRAEQALRESEERFRTMADGLPLIIWVHDAEGRQQFVNETFCKFFGVTQEETRDGRWQLLLHPDEGEAYAEEFQACTREHRPFHGSVRVQNAAGEWRWIESWGQPRFSATGEFLGMIGASADITERKRAEEAQRESERLLAAAQRVARIGSWSWDIRTGELQWSEELFAMYGVDSDRFVPSMESFADFVHPDDRAMVNEQIAQILAGDERVDFEFRIISATGATLTLTVVGQVMERDAEGAPLLVVGANQDITARKRMEEALRESEERYRSLVTHAPAGIYEVDFRTRKFTSVNEEMCELLGYSREELLAIDPFEILDEPGRLRFQERINRWLAGERVDRNVEYRITTRDGRVIYVLLDVTLTVDESGQPVGATVVGHDITERKRTEEALAAATRRLEAHLANSPLAIIEFDGSFVITRWSREAEAMFGWSSEEVLGKRIGDFPWVHEDDIERVATISREMLEGKKPSNMHRNRNYRKDGTVVHCEWYNSAIRDDAGELTSVFSQVLDVTASERAEESLQASKEQLSAILLQAPVGIAVFDHDGNIVTSNELWTRLIPGKMPARDIERNWRAWGPGGRLLETSEFPSTRALRGETIRLETDFMYTAADGSEVWVRIGAAPLHNKSGEIVGGIAVVQEVSALKRIEQALKESEERFRLMADSAPVPIWVSGLQGTGFVNRAYREFVGLASDIDMADFDWTQYVHPEDHDTYLHTYLACFEQRVPFEAVFRFRRHDGVYRWMKSVGQPRFSTSGEFEGYVGCTVDITDVNEKEGRKLEDEVLDR